MKHLSKSGIVQLGAIGGVIGSRTAKMNEKWDTDADIKKTGEHAGKSVQQLKSELDSLKAKSKQYQDKDQPVPDAIKKQEHEIMFAIRAKQGWKKGEGAMGENINETKFYAFFNNKKHEIEGTSLWDAKQKAISMLKVPKSKVGYLTIVNAADHDKGGYRFENVNEAKYPTDLKVGSVIKGVGFTRLKGIEGGKYYKIVDMDDTTATLSKTDASGRATSSSKVRHKLDSIEAGIKTAKRGDENGIELIKEEYTETPKETLEGLKEMAMGNLERIADYADMISERMNNGQNLESWMYSQITLALDQLNSVHDAMDGKDGVKEGIENIKEGYTVRGDNPYQFTQGVYSVLSAYLRDEKLGSKEERMLKDVISNLQYLAKYFHSQKNESIKEGIENVANGLPQTMGKEKSLKRETLKGIVREVMAEEAEYQQFFQKVLAKAGKSIPSMSDEEKKNFFNKVDAAWKAKQEGLVGNQHKLDVDKDGDIGADDLADLRAGKKANESVNEAANDIKVGDMIKVVDNPHWEAAMGKKGPFKRKVKGIHGDSVFFTDGSNSSMKYVKK